jgi:hypothetical protein
VSLDVSPADADGLEPDPGEPLLVAESPADPVPGVSFFVPSFGNLVSSFGNLDSSFDFFASSFVAPSLGNFTSPVADMPPAAVSFEDF